MLAGHGNLHQLVAQRGAALVGDAKVGQLLDMVVQRLGVEDEALSRARAIGLRRREPTDVLGGNSEAGALPPGRSGRPVSSTPAAGRASGHAVAARADEGVEAAQPFVAVELADRGSAIAWVLDEALLEAGAGLGRVEGRGFDFVAPQAVDQRLGAGGSSASTASLPAGADQVVGSWPEGSDEAQGALRREVGQGAQSARTAAFCPAASPSKQQIGWPSRRHMRSSWASVTAVPLGATASAIPARSRAMTSI